MMYKKTREVITQCIEAYDLLTNDDIDDMFYDLMEDLFPTAYIKSCRVTLNDIMALRVSITAGAGSRAFIETKLHEYGISYEFENIMMETVKFSLRVPDILDFLVKEDSKELIQTIQMQDEVDDQEALIKRMDRIENRMENLAHRFSELCDCFEKDWKEDWWE